MNLKRLLIIIALCISAALMAGCTAQDSRLTTSPDMTVVPAQGTANNQENTPLPGGDVNVTPGGERGLQPGGLNMTEGAPMQPTGGGMGGNVRPSGLDEGMNGTPPAPGERPGGMQPPDPPATLS